MVSNSLSSLGHDDGSSLINHRPAAKGGKYEWSWDEKGNVKQQVVSTSVTS